MIYLDHAATTPVPKAVADAMYTVLTEQYANPNAQYPFGQEMRRSVEDWRAVIAKAVGCEANQLFFTSCGTEGDNWAIRAACWQNRHVGRHIVTTAVEHHAVLNCCQQLEQEGWEVTTILPDQNGDISAESVLAAVRPDTALVSVMMVNNELGSIYPIADIAKGLKAVNEKTLLHTDAVQGFLKVPFSAKALGADFIAISGHKIGAPKGIGALYVKKGIHIPPFMLGGGQEKGFRSGTESVPLICGFGAAVKKLAPNVSANFEKAADIQAYLIEKCNENGDVFVNSRKGGSPYVTSIAVNGLKSEVLLHYLEKREIYVSSGSACSKGKKSSVLKEFRYPEQSLDSTIRISFSIDTTKADIDALMEGIKSAQNDLCKVR